MITGSLVLARRWVAPLGLAILMGTSAGAAPKKARTYYGPPAALGQGQIRTYVTLGANQLPASVGVEFDADSLNDLPSAESDGRWDVVNAAGEVVWHCCGHEVELGFAPEVAGLIPFQHFVINWNPEGHPPPGVFDPPHFDFHFYNISSAQRRSILAPTAETACTENGFVPVTCSDFEMLTQPLPAEQQPPNHVNVGAVEPGMGNHLLNFGSAEWSGKPFTHTWIFGTMGGSLSFWEPMITRDYLHWVQSLSPSDRSAVDPNGGAIQLAGSGAAVTVRR